MHKDLRAYESTTIRRSFKKRGEMLKCIDNYIQNKTGIQNLVVFASCSLQITKQMERPKGHNEPKHKSLERDKAETKCQSL